MPRIAPLLLPAVLLGATGSALAADFEHAIILIADDLGTDRVGAYAVDVYNPTETRPPTPNMDALAAVGVRFSDAWATPLCSPTRAMLYAGEYPFRTGVGENEGHQMPLDPDTLPMRAQDNGVAVALFGKAHIGEKDESLDAPTRSRQDFADYPIDVGFEVFQGNNDGAVGSYSRWLYVESLPFAANSSGYATSAAYNTVSPTDQVNDDALDWLDEQSAAGTRRIAVVSYHLPHAAGGSSESWATAASSCGGTSTGDETEDQKLAVGCLDDALLTFLSGVPDLEDTLIVFLGDNGTPKRVPEGYFDDERGKGTVYENGARVPFVVADGAAVQDMLDGVSTTGPYRVEAGLTSADPASVVDVYATLADLLDLSAGPCTLGETCARDSQSLRAVLSGDAPTRASTWTELNTPAGTNPATGEGAVRVGDVKLIVRIEHAQAPCRTYELYDLAADRWELDDLYDDPAYATEQASLRAEVDAISADMLGSTVDWLNHADCDACLETETWYDGFDSNCDRASDYDQDLDGVDWPEDCLDTDATAYPGAADVWYDGVDSDCDGANDLDQDGDSFDLADDCDDTDATVWPGARETPYDGIDADCMLDSDFDADGDGIDAVAWGGTDCDDADASIWPGASDFDGDGIDSDCDGAVEIDDGDGDGAAYAVDCDDDDASTYPGAADAPYDGVDQDCAGDDDFDADGDGYRPLAYGGNDCDDADATTYPGAGDAWYDGVDSDCDGANDYDQDGDGARSATYGGPDCDDVDRRVKPSAREIWYDGVDQNCDGADDDDADRDGYSSEATGGTDCNDRVSAVKPGAAEIWYDGVDQNCDDADDFDRDGDGWPRSTDCDDGAPRRYPGAPGWNLDCTRA